MKKIYIKGDFIWFPRRKADHQDIGVRVDSITGVKPEEDNSIVFHSGGKGLRAFQTAEKVAEIIWGEGNFINKKGTYVPK